MKRINPHTKKPFEYKDIREDGYIFQRYQKAISNRDYDRADMFWARYQEARDRTVTAKNRAESLIKK